MGELSQTRHECRAYCRLRREVSVCAAQEVIGLPTSCRCATQTHSGGAITLATRRGGMCLRDPVCCSTALLLCPTAPLLLYSTSPPRATAGLPSSASPPPAGGTDTYRQPVMRHQNASPGSVRVRSTRGDWRSNLLSLRDPVCCSTARLLCPTAPLLLYSTSPPCATAGLPSSASPPPPCGPRILAPSIGRWPASGLAANREAVQHQSPGSRNASRISESDERSRPERAKENSPGQDEASSASLDAALG